MIILISGDTHTGKTNLAQKLLEHYKLPYLSIDHLKMGLIRSGNTDLTPQSDDNTLTEKLWPIVREMIKTCVENNQSLIVEGCYIPWDWQRGFTEEERKSISYLCLIFSRDYLEKNFSQIKEYENVIERRQYSELSLPDMLHCNEKNLQNCLERHLDHILIDDKYEVFPQAVASIENQLKDAWTYMQGERVSKKSNIKDLSSSRSKR